MAINTEIIKTVSDKLNIKEEQIMAVLSLLDEGATIPFIARYRKEKTNNLDEVEIHDIATTYDYENKLFIRKQEVIAAIDEKGKLTPELLKAINEATTLKVVEDLYLPYKEKKKTRASEAIRKGLEPLANLFLEFKDIDVNAEASKFINDEVKTVEDAINGAKDIIAERIADDIEYRNLLTKSMHKFGNIITSLKKQENDERKVYEDYYNYTEPVRFIANHRILAINRGENENVLKVKIENNDPNIIYTLQRKLIKVSNKPANKYLIEALEDAFKRLLYPSIENEIRNELKERAETKAIELFTINLEQLLLTPPLKNRTILGLDPAFRTGCKLAIINERGEFVEKDVIYPHQKFPGENVSEKRILEAETKVVRLVKKYGAKLIAIGNGTASRESEEFIANTIKKYDLDTSYVIVSEAGASVYSASPLAIKEFPDLVVEERSAISIARRVLDPLAELIKIDPKSIGVGQYQHDVNQRELEEGLDFTISKIVNNVGVNINTSSVSLLSYVSGLSKKTAQNIIDYREENGAFKSRDDIKKVKGIGPKSYEQAIGFLKILDSTNPLDKTFIHPENYPLVLKMISDLGLDITKIGSDEFNEKLSSLIIKDLAAKYNIGEYSLTDIIEELKKPLRDIRDEYPTPLLKKDILHIEDLKEGMVLQGSVRSIVDFGAFVDIGLKNDGMIHKSKMGQKVNHPLDILSIGDIVTVKVINVDLDKKRVGLELVKN